MRAPTRARGLLPVMMALVGCYRGGPQVADDDGTTGMDDAGTATGGDETDGNEDGDALPLQPLHRLNRLEFNNTVRDLLGSNLRPADAFGVDAEANGFDNMAEQLGLSPVQLDGYAKAARDVIA